MNITDNLKEEKYVAFLDVLGFKELVIKKEKKLNSYFNTILKALDDINLDKPKIKSQLVSDSTILSCDLTREDLRLLLKAVQTIQSRCALENIWIRGAISIGDVYFHVDPNIVVGSGLSDAYLLESQEKFPRVIIDPKIIQGNFDTRTSFINEYNLPNEVPLIHANNEQVKYIENDAFFISFAERIADDDFKNLDKVYIHIKNELYKGQKNYQKYFWLKNYFTEALNQRYRIFFDLDEDMWNKTALAAQKFQFL